MHVSAIINFNITNAAAAVYAVEDRLAFL